MRELGSPDAWRPGQTYVLAARPGRGWCRKLYKKFVSLIQTAK
jgi:hypothetical protein